MAKFDIDMWARTRYIIEAETEEEAIDQAMEFWYGLIPDTFCEKVQPSCSNCYNVDQDTSDKVAFCNCCENYSFYTPID